MASCFSLLSPNFFTNLQNQLNGAESPEELQSIINKIFADLSLMESTMTGQIDLLGPIAALLTAPISPTQAVTWIGNFINDFLQPIYIPYAKQIAQLAALASEISTLTSAINSIASTKFPGISFTIPTVNPNFCAI